MTDGTSFHGAPTTRGRRDGPFVLVVALVVAGIALAIAKPWGNAGGPTVPSAPGAALASPPGPSAAASADGLRTYVPVPAPGGFSAPAGSGSSTWSGLAWQRLAPGDLFALVRTEVTAGGTSVAIGDIPGSTSTMVWSSTDGTHWQPVDSNTPTTFWPNLSLIALATVKGRFVAISEMNDYLLRDLPPVIAWASDDGRTWAPSPTLPVDPLSSPAGSTAIVASGPNGLLVATSGLGARLATSSNGSDWDVAPARAFPADFALADLEGSGSGFVAVGSWTKGSGPDQAAALWSADGRTWPKGPTLLPTAAQRSGKPTFSNAVTLTVGDQGMIATGIGGALGSALWWQSADGRHWQGLPGFPPVGPTSCGGPNCRPQPNGTLFGDGHRLVALRGGTAGAGWVSTDGQGWQRLSFSGDLPDAQATQATLLPGGVMLSNGTTTWFGQATGP